MLLSFVIVDKLDNTEEKKSPKSTYGAFYQLPHYMKLYEVMKSAFNNYRVTYQPFLTIKPDYSEI